MSSTLAMLRQACRSLAGDNNLPTVFSDAQFDEWINQAISDLSQHFPRQRSLTFVAVDGQYSFALPDDCRTLLWVSHPAGERSPHYLRRRALTQPHFWDQPGWYDVLRRQDGDSAAESELLLSGSPAAGDRVTIEYLAEHRRLLDSGDSTSLLPRHVALIPLFVRWRAWQALAGRAALSGSSATTLAESHEMSAARAESAYRRALHAAQAGEGESQSVVWRMDCYDRVY